MPVPRDSDAHPPGTEPPIVDASQRIDVLRGSRDDSAETALPPMVEPSPQLVERPSRKALPTFAIEEEAPSPTSRHIDAFSNWTSIVKPFLLDNVGWFVGSFLVIAGFVVLIVTFWNTIEENQILMHSLVFASMLFTTGLFFATAYFMRIRYPELESSSDVLLVIVALLIPLVFAAAILTALIPAAEIPEAAFLSFRR